MKNRGIGWAGAIVVLLIGISAGVVLNSYVIEGEYFSDSSNEGENQSPESNDVTSIKAIMQNSSSYRGKVVTIEGKYESGSLSLIGDSGYAIPVLSQSPSLNDDANYRITGIISIVNGSTIIDATEQEKI